MLILNGYGPDRKSQKALAQNAVNIVIQSYDSTDDIMNAIRPITNTQHPFPILARIPATEKLPPSSPFDIEGCDGSDHRHPI